MPFRMRALNLVLPLSFALGPLGPSAAWGQTVEQKAGARATAEAGAEAFDEGRYQEAIDLFSRAEAVVHAPPHLLHIARAYAKLGKWVSAQETYLKIVREHLPSGAPDPFREAWADADRELGELEPRIPQLTIRVEGAVGEELHVTMDGQPVPGALLGVAQPADPGAHEISAEAVGGRKVARSLTLAAGARESVVLTLPQPAPGAQTPVAGPAPTPLPPAEPPSRSFLTEPAVAYGALGVGAVGLGIGTAYLVSYLGAKHDADKAFAACMPDCSTAERSHLDQLDSRTAERGTISVIGMVVGGLGVATGVTLLVLGNQRQSDTTRRTAVYPYLGGSAVGLWGRY
jgi:hypothetical protein